MPFKSVTTVFNPRGIKIVGFKVGLYNKKHLASLSVEEMKNMVGYFDDCIRYVTQYKNWIAGEIVKKSDQNDLKHPINGVLATFSGKEFIAQGHLCDEVGETLDPEAMYEHRFVGQSGYLRKIEHQGPEMPTEHRNDVKSE